MKECYLEAKRLREKAKIIEEELFKQNPGTNGAMPIKDLLHLIAKMPFRYVELYAELRKKNV